MSLAPPPDQPEERARHDPPYFLRGGGEAGARLRNLDWSRSPLGEPERWPRPLQSATAMMLNTLQPMFIAWGPELVFLYNDAYVPILGQRHPAALGEPYGKTWPGLATEPALLLDKVFAGEPSWREDLPLLTRRHGYPEQTHFSFSYSPLYAEDGAVGGVLCCCMETTARVIAEQRLSRTAEALAASEARYRRQSERLFSLFENAPGQVLVMEGPEHVITLANANFRRMVGDRDVIGMPFRRARPDQESTGALKRLDRVYATGRTNVGIGIKLPIQRSPDAPVEQRYYDVVNQPIRDEAGRVTGVFLQGYDVTDRELSAQRQALLLNELNHRVKNNLATVQSIAAQTARRSADLATFIDAFEGRLVALARAHDALLHNVWTGADLHDLLQRELSGIFSDRLRLEGPPVRLNAIQAQAIGLIAHELATNAAKYGALSAPAGLVRVSWRQTGDRFHLDWVETGGPPVQPPKRQGFGSRLIAKLAQGDLGGEVETSYAPEGLRLRLSGPIRSD